MLTNKSDFAIEAGTFTPDKDIQHTHAGSIGNLCNDEILAYKNELIKQFNFERWSRRWRNYCPDTKGPSRSETSPII